MPIGPGSRLGPYEVTALIGEGGMGKVWRAHHMALKRDDALKVLPDAFASDPDRLARFRREAQVLASLNHPNIAHVYGLEQSDGVQALVMELVEGPTLADRIARGPIPVDEALPIARQIAEGLEAAHGQGIIHRDLKPANIKVRPDGTVKVLDFGLAKIVETVSESLASTIAPTHAGVVVGTVAYMSPEQARGDPVDARSDVFSLGALLYEMVAGQPTFQGATAAVIFDAILNRRVRSLREVVSDAPVDFIALVEGMLAKRAADRPPNARSVAAAVREIETRGRSSRRSSGAVATRTPSIAVLPFADMSAQKDQDYFCEGMAEELITALSKLQGMRVASRTSAFRFKGAEDIRRIGEHLGVETVLEGSVRSAGTRLRITAQLTSVADGYQIWSERYDRQMEDVFDIQDEIARAIVGMLKVKLLASEDATIVKRGTDNLEAYHLCLKARYHWFKWTDDGFRRATELFQQALVLDPNYPLALFGLADSYSAIAFVGMERDPGVCVSMLERAVRFDSEFAEAHAVLGIHYGMWMWRWAAAERCFETAIRINPRDPHVLQLAALQAALLGRAEEAVALGRRAVDLDPVNPFWNAALALIHLHIRRYDEAVKQARVTLDLVPTFWMAHVWTGLAEAALGGLTEAVAALERAVANSQRMPYAIGWLGFALAKAEGRQAAEAQLNTLLERAAHEYIPALSIACVCAGLNDRGRALEALERAYVQKDPWLSTHLAGWSIFDDLRSDARFIDLRDRVLGT